MRNYSKNDTELCGISCGFSIFGAKKRIVVE